MRTEEEEYKLLCVENLPEECELIGDEPVLIIGLDRVRFDNWGQVFAFIKGLNYTSPVGEFLYDVLAGMAARYSFNQSTKAKNATSEHIHTEKQETTEEVPKETSGES